MQVITAVPMVVRSRGKAANLDVLCMRVVAFTFLVTETRGFTRNKKTVSLLLNLREVRMAPAGYLLIALSYQAGFLSLSLPSSENLLRIPICFSKRDILKNTFLPYHHLL